MTNMVNDRAVNADLIKDVPPKTASSGDRIGSLVLVGYFNRLSVGTWWYGQHFTNCSSNYSINNGEKIWQLTPNSIVSYLVE